MKRVHLEDNGQDLVWLDIDAETGRILDVSPACSSTVANIYIGNVVDINAIVIGERLRIKDVSNGGKVFQTKWYVIEIVNL